MKSIEYVTIWNENVTGGACVFTHRLTTFYLKLNDGTSLKLAPLLFKQTQILAKQNNQRIRAFSLKKDS